MPTTEAGRSFHVDLHVHDGRGWSPAIEHDGCTYRRYILAIEEQAAKAERERLLDMGRIAAALNKHQGVILGVADEELAAALHAALLKEPRK